MNTFGKIILGLSMPVLLSGTGAGVYYGLKYHDLKDNQKVIQQIEDTSGVRQTIKELNDAITILTIEKSTLTAQLRDLTSENEINIALVQSLRQQLNNLSSTAEENAELQNRITSLLETIDRRDAQISSLSSQIQNLNNEVQRLSALIQEYEDLQVGRSTVNFYIDGNIVITKVVKNGQTLDEIGEFEEETSSYKFKYWTLDGQYVDPLEVTITQDINFNAVIFKKYEFSILFNGQKIYSQFCLNGSSPTIISPIEIEGYIFDHYEYEDGSTVWSFSNITMESDLTIIAKYKQNLLSSPVTLTNSSFVGSGNERTATIDVQNLDVSDEFDVAFTSLSYIDEDDQALPIFDLAPITISKNGSIVGDRALNNQTVTFEVLCLENGKITIKATSTNWQAVQPETIVISAIAKYQTNSVNNDTNTEAPNETQDDLSNFTFDGAMVTAYNGSEDRIVIPESYSLNNEIIPVTVISDEFVSNSSELSMIVIPKTINGFMNYYPSWDGFRTLDLSDYIVHYKNAEYACSATGTITFQNQAYSGGTITLPTVFDYVTGQIPLAILGSKSFYGSGYEEIIVSEGYTTIKTDAFANSLLLKEVVFASTVTDISNKASNNMFRGCDSLESVTFLSEIPPTIQAEEGVFAGRPDYFVIYVHASALNAYKAKAETWGLQESQIIAIQE